MHENTLPISSYYFHLDMMAKNSIPFEISSYVLEMIAVTSHQAAQILCFHFHPNSTSTSCFCFLYRTSLRLTDPQTLV